jgi:hypothetical protein
MKNYTEAEILENAIEIKEILGMEITEEDYAEKDFFADLRQTIKEDLEKIEGDEPKAEEAKVENVTSKIKCKVCGFHKKPRKVLRDTGVCGVCTESLKDSAETGTVEVVGRMGKRGRNTVSVMVNGQRFKVKRLSNRHSENVAAKHVAKGRGYAKQAKRHVSDIESPKGLPTSSRLAGDPR